METKDKLSIFQNLYLVAAADGRLEPSEKEILLRVSEQMNLTIDDIAPILQNRNQLQFIISDHSDERIFDLRDLVEMMTADGDISDSEYKLCNEFALAAGFDQLQFDEIVQQQIQKIQIKNTTREINLLTYDRIFQKVEASGIDYSDLVDAIQAVIQKKDVTVSVEEKGLSDVKLYQLIWIIFVRQVQLDVSKISVIPSYLDLIRIEEYSLDRLKEMLKEEESSNGIDRIHLLKKELTEIKADIMHFSQFFKKIINADENQ